MSVLTVGGVVLRVYNTVIFLSTLSNGRTFIMKSTGQRSTLANKRTRPPAETRYWVVYSFRSVRIKKRINKLKFRFSFSCQNEKTKKRLVFWFLLASIIPRKQSNKTYLAPQGARFQRSRWPAWGEYRHSSVEQTDQNYPDIHHSCFHSCKWQQGEMVLIQIWTSTHWVPPGTGYCGPSSGR